MAFKFEDDDLFAPKVKSGTLEQGGKVFYWLNGKGGEHSAFSKLIAEDKTRQAGWEKVVYNWRCNEKGEPWYKGKMLATDFHENVDRILARDLGMLFMGVRDSEGNDISEFDEQIEEEVKNSPKASAA